MTRKEYTEWERWYKSVVDYPVSTIQHVRSVNIYRAIFKGVIIGEWSFKNHSGWIYYQE